jgi:hypothetical protein
VEIGLRIIAQIVLSASSRSSAISCIFEIPSDPSRSSAVFHIFEVLCDPPIEIPSDLPYLRGPQRSIEISRSSAIFCMDIRDPQRSIEVLSDFQHVEVLRILPFF